jgi:hypothetical protein
MIDLFCIKINLRDRWSPVIINDTGVTVFFLIMAAINLAMAFIFLFWSGYHLVCFIFCIWWPWMIHKGHTHKGLSHASYGLATMIPHLLPLQIWGSAFLVDKIVNWNTLTWPHNGAKVLRPLKPNGEEDFWTDRDPSNMFVDNHPFLKLKDRPYPLWVALSFYLPITIALCIADFLLNWFSMYYIRGIVAFIYFCSVYSSLYWLFTHPVPR